MKKNWIFGIICLLIIGIFAFSCITKLEKNQSNTEEKTIQIIQKKNINTATYQEIVELEGIGEKIATEIMKHRPFQNIQEIQHLEGIGEKKMAEIEKYFKVW